MPTTRSSGYAFEAGSQEQHPSQWSVAEHAAPDADDHALVVADVSAVKNGDDFAAAVQDAARTAKLIAAGNAGPQHMLQFVKTMAAFAPAIATENFVDEHLASQHQNLMAVVETAIKQQTDATVGFVGNSQREFATQFYQECQNFGALICGEVDRRLMRANTDVAEAAAGWKEDCRLELAKAMEHIARSNNEAALVLQGVREEASQANAHTAAHLSELLVARTNSLSEVFNSAIAEVRAGNARVTTEMAAQKANLDSSLSQMQAIVYQQESTMKSTMETMADTAAVRRATDVFVRLTQSNQATFEASQAHSQALVEASQATQRSETNALVLGARGEIAQQAASQNAETLQRMTDNMRMVSAMFHERARAQAQEFRAQQDAALKMAAAEASVARATERHEMRAHVTQASANVFSKSIETSSASLHQTATAHQSTMDELANQLQSAQAQLVLVTTSVKTLERQVVRLAKSTTVDAAGVERAVKQADANEASVNEIEADVAKLQRAVRGVTDADEATTARLRKLEEKIRELTEDVEDNRQLIKGCVAGIEARSPGSTPASQRAKRDPGPTAMRQPAFGPNDDVEVVPPRGQSAWPTSFSRGTRNDPPTPRRHADPTEVPGPVHRTAHFEGHYSSEPAPATRTGHDAAPRQHDRHRGGPPDDSSDDSSESSEPSSSTATSACAEKLRRKMAKDPEMSKMQRVLVKAVTQAVQQQQPQQQQQQQQPYVQTIVVDNGGFSNSDALTLNRLHKGFTVTFAKHLSREHIVETSGELAEHRIMSDAVRGKIVIRLHLAADLLPSSALYLRELMEVIKESFGSNDIELHEMNELGEAYDSFVKVRRAAIDPTPQRDQVLCLTQTTAKFPAFYPDFDKAVVVFDALRTLRRRIIAAICSVARNPEVQDALKAAIEDDVVCKRVVDNKIGFDFIAIASAKMTRGRGRAPAAAGAGAPTTTPAESKRAQRRRQREEREAAAKQSQASGATPANAAPEARGAAAPAGGAAPARKPSNTGTTGKAEGVRDT
jgi:hypothetical protein